MNDLFGSNGNGKRAKPTPQPQPSDYSAKDIEVLEGLEPVRRRPGMYIGGTDETALHHLAAETLDNAMDEAVAGHASFIEVALEQGNYLTVRDNDRGIPVDPHPKFKQLSALEVIRTALHSGGKFGGKAYQTSGGLHGVGASVLNTPSTVSRAAHGPLLVEQVGVRAGSGELQLLALDAVEQQPIRLDVEVAEAVPITLERVIAIAGRERLFLDQQREDGLQLVHLLATPLGAPHIAFEPAGPDRREHFRCQGP